eukprot:1587697-Rhodomonas_salina.1
MQKQNTSAEHTHTHTKRGEIKGERRARPYTLYRAGGLWPLIPRRVPGGAAVSLGACAAIYGCSAAIYGCSAAIYGCSAAIYGGSAA